MKTQSMDSNQRRESGMVTLIFLILLTIMVILATVNTRTVNHLQRETKLLEQKQVQRLTGTTHPPINNVSQEAK